MNVMTTMYGTCLAALLTIGAINYGDDVLATVASQSEGAALASETTVLAQAIGTEAEMPATLTCVPDATSACDHFAEYDFEVTGDYVYALQHTPNGGFVLYGATPDGSQRVAFDSEHGGITDLSATALSADSVPTVG